MKPKPQQGLDRQQCTLCHCWLELDLFHKDIKRHNGRKRECRQCWNKLARKEYKKRSDGLGCGKRTYYKNAPDLIARQILETNAFWTEIYKEEL